MPVDNSQTQTKKYHPGFFALLAIIAVVIFSAYALTSKRQEVSLTNNQLSETEKQNMINSLAGVAENIKPLSESEKQNMIKSIGDTKNIKPLTDAEKQALVSQFQN